MDKYDTGGNLIGNVSIPDTSIEELIARIENLELHVKELQWWGRPTPGTGGEGAEMVLPRDMTDSLQLRSEA